MEQERTLPTKVITLRITKKMKLAIEAASHDDRMSMNAWIVKVLNKELGENHASQKPDTETRTT